MSIILLSMSIIRTVPIMLSVIAGMIFQPVIFAVSWLVLLVLHFFSMLVSYHLGDKGHRRIIESASIRRFCDDSKLILCCTSVCLLCGVASY